MDLPEKVEMLEKLTMFNNNSDVDDTVQEVGRKKENTLVERMKSIKKIQDEEEVEVVQQEEKTNRK